MPADAATLKDNPVPELLESLLQDFDTGAATSGRAIRQLLSREPVRVRAAALLALRPEASSSGHEYLLRLLLAQGLLVEPLSDPAVMDVADAVRLARRAARIDPTLDVKLADRIPVPGESGLPTLTCDAVTGHILEVLSAISNGNRILPKLMQLLHRPCPRIHSKAILLLVRSRRDAKWIATVFSHPDPRVRANAVEAVWGLQFSWLPAQLRRACEDSNNRVVANALVALYKLGESDIPARLQEMAGDGRDATERASAAWAMGLTGDPLFIPVLEQIARRSSGSLHVQSLRALVRIRKGTSPQQSEPTAAES